MSRPAILSLLGVALPALWVAGLLLFSARQAGQVPALEPASERAAVPFVTTARFRAGGAITGSPAVAPNGDFFIGSHDGFLYALDAGLQLLWKRNLGAVIYGGVLRTPSEQLYVGTDAKVLWAFDARGRLRWKRTLPAAIETTPAWSSAGLVLVCAGRELFGLWPDGKLAFRFKAWNKFVASPVVDLEGKAYLGSQDGNFYGLAADGTERFRVYGGSAIDAKALVDSLGRSFFADVAGRVRAVDPGGEQMWTRSLDSSVRAPLALGPQGEVLVLTEGPRVRFVALDPATGALLAQQTLALTDGDPGVARGGIAIPSAHQLWVASPERLWLLNGVSQRPRALARVADPAVTPWHGDLGYVFVIEITGEIVRGRPGVIPSLPQAPTFL